MNNIRVTFVSIIVFNRTKFMEEHLLDKSRSKIVLENRTIFTIFSKDLLETSIIIPNEQRIRDDDKVNDIVSYQQNELRNRGHCNFIGTINIHFCGDTQKFYLVDGQHRYEAIKRISRTNNISVVVELVVVTTLDELKRNYQMINLNTPLPEFSEAIDKNVPEKVALLYKSEYSQMWSKNSRARRPNIYFIYFQEALGVITEKLKIENALELKKIVDDYNVRLSKWDFTQFPDSKNLNDCMVQKCRETGLFLGLFRHISDEYCYEWVREIVKQYTGEDMRRTQCKNTSSKASISKSLKTSIWDTNIGKNIRTALCICCNNTEIKIENFHAGHIVAESVGGATDHSNLLPICSACNTSMGVLDMNEFIKRNFPNNYVNFTKRSYTKMLKPKRSILGGLFR